MQPADREDPFEFWLRPSSGTIPKPLLGTMNFGRRTPEAEAHRILDRAWERGLRVVDTADSYGEGASELILGKWMKQRARRLHVLSKVGLARSHEARGLSARAIQLGVEGSLRRLGLDSLELYLLHAPDRQTPLQETLEALAFEHQGGRIRRLGASNFASWELLELQQGCRTAGLSPPVLTQVLWNGLARGVETELVPFAVRHGWHVSAYNPLAGGLLASRPGQPVRKGARFKSPIYEARYGSRTLSSVAESLRCMAEEAGASLLELAYGLLSRPPHPDSIALGPATVEQLDASLEALARPPAEHLLLEARRQLEEAFGWSAVHVR